MGNIIDYVNTYGNLTFDDMAFGEVDSLVLSQLCYLNIESRETSSEQFLATIYDLTKLDESVLVLNVWEPEKNIRLLYDCAKSVRFGGISIANFVNLTDEKTEKQFAAMTFKLKNGLYYIAFRGTDANLVGWKEDFNLSYMKKIPSQELAIKYLKKVTRSLDGKFILGGHSKGGNLALYAAIFARNKIKKDILSVYDHDGPGFSDYIYKEKGLKKILPKLHKTIPQTAIVGLLLAKDIPFRVVESQAFGLMQHDPFMWQVKGAAFKTREETDPFSKYTVKKINDWLQKVDNEKRKIFVDTIYETVCSTGAKTYFDLFQNKRAAAKKILKSINEYDPEVKELIKSLARELVGKKEKTSKNTKSWFKAKLHK